MLRDLLQKITIVLSLEYLLFFSAEVVLPGVITSVFNINVLLLSILILGGILVALGYETKNECDRREKTKRSNKMFLLLGIFLLITNAVALYKVSIGMTLLYTVMVTIVVKLLWKNK